MEKLDVKSEEALAWVAGFFCGEGTISVSRGKTQNRQIIGMVKITQRSAPETLEFMRSVLLAHGMEVRPVYYYKKGDWYELSFSSAAGADFLQLIYPYLVAEKYKRRADAYFKMFPPGERYLQMREARLDGYIGWQKLKITELQEKGD